MGTNYVKKARTVRIPPITNFQINSFDTGVRSSTGSYILNGIIQKYSDDKYYVTQRPSFSVFNKPADGPVADIQGRGAYYWDQTDKLYFINDTTIYQSNYGTALTGETFTSGTEKIEVSELGDQIVFVNAEDNEMLYVDAGTGTVARSMNISWTGTEESLVFADNGGSPDTITTTTDLTLTKALYLGDVIKITGSTSNDGTYTVASHVGKVITLAATDELDNETVTCTISAYNALPQNNNKQLAHGIETLDQTMYVLDTDGQIWGSAIGSAHNWTDATNFITAEREEDEGIYLSKHHEDLVVFGRRTIEFFHSAGNATGSPLSVRGDIAYNIGCADPNSVWRYGDEIYFLGIDTSGQIRPYVLKEFQVNPIAEGSITSFFTTSKSLDNLEILAHGMSSGGITYYLITTYSKNGGAEITPQNTYVYNSHSQTWTEWEYSGDDIDAFPLIGYTITNDDRIGEGILVNGELVYVVDNFQPYDASQDITDDYVASEYVGTGYVLAGADSTINTITMKIRLDNWDADSRDWKFAHQLRYVGDSTKNSNSMTIRWNDDNNITASPLDVYTGTRTIDLQNSLNKLTRLGRFKSRSFEFEYSGTEQIRFEGIDLDITEGTH